MELRQKPLQGKINNDYGQEEERMNTNTPGATQSAIDMLKRGRTADEIIRELKFPAVGAYLFEFICKRDVSILAVAEQAELNRTSLYRILEGQLNPARDALLRLSRVLDMSLDQTQTLLKYGNAAALSGVRARDIKIMDGILKGRPLGDINEALTASGFSDLSNKRRNKKED